MACLSGWKERVGLVALEVGLPAFDIDLLSSRHVVLFVALCELLVSSPAFAQMSFDLDFALERQCLCA